MYNLPRAIAECPSQIHRSIETEKLSDPTVRSVTEKYLSFGETIFDMVQGTVVNSQYFKRDSRR